MTEQRPGTSKNTQGHMPDADPPPLALSAPEAATALGIGERLLWSETNAGKIPHVRIGRRVVYPIKQLQAYLEREAARSVR
jgi:predicted DNA-binding transcriptional regulator AlpA